MPAIVLFKRRWRVGSDDLFLPAIFLVFIHLIWIGILLFLFGIIDFSKEVLLLISFQEFLIGLLVIYLACIVLECGVAIVSVRGNILSSQARAPIAYLLYVRLGLLMIELLWQIFGIVWIVFNSTNLTLLAQCFIVGSVLCDWVAILIVISIFSRAVPLNVNTNNVAHSHPGNFLQQDSSRHLLCDNNGTEQKVIVTSTKPCRRFEKHRSVCCFRQHSKENSLSDVGTILSELLTDLDLVPSDITAGLILLKGQQKRFQNLVVSESSNEVYQFLSGSAITQSTRFLSLKNSECLKYYNRVIHFMNFPLAAYNLSTSSAFHQQMSPDGAPTSGCCRCSHGSKQSAYIIERNEKYCPFIMEEIQKLIGSSTFDLVYISYHSDVIESDVLPFFIGLDHEQQAIVVCIWGRLCIQDIFAEVCGYDVGAISLDTIKEDWFAHMGFVQAAEKINDRINRHDLLIKAMQQNQAQGAGSYEVVVVGHSLAAGVASILAIFLKPVYLNVHCYAYSPPSGILGDICIEETKSFITSVVVGKDLVPRFGLHQVELFRHSLIHAMKSSKHSKCRVICGHKSSCAECCGESNFILNGKMNNDAFALKQLSMGQNLPMFLPGRVIHIVRSHPKNRLRCLGSFCGRQEAVFQAIWSGNTDFNEILVSPTMFADHSPQNVLDALKKVLTHVSPAKPYRKPVKSSRCETLTPPNTSSDLICEPSHSDVFLRSTDCESEPIGTARAINLSTEPHSPWLNSVTHLQEPTLVQLRGGTRPNNFIRGHRQNLLDLRRDDWLGFAPLASPEVLSETSSLASCGSGRDSFKRLSTGYQRLTSSISRMDPIKQSPLTHNLRGYCLLVEPNENKTGNSIGGNSGCIVLSPSTETLSQKIPECQNLQSRTTEETVESAAHHPVDSSETEAECFGDDPLVNKRSTEFTNVEVHRCDGNDSFLLDDQSEGYHFDYIAGLKSESDTNEDMDHMFPKTLKCDPRGANDGHEQQARPFSTDVSLNLPIIETVYHGANSSMESRNNFDTDSIDSSSGRQYLYDMYDGHYSPAGRGYPHGFHHLPGCCADDLIDALKDPAALHSNHQHCGCNSIQNCEDNSDHFDDMSSSLQSCCQSDDITSDVRIQVSS